MIGRLGERNSQLSQIILIELFWIAIGKKSCVKQRGQIGIVVMSGGQSYIFLKSSYGKLSETPPTLSLLTTLSPHVFSVVCIPIQPSREAV